jgi:hypothetical protein
VLDRRALTTLDMRAHEGREEKAVLRAQRWVNRHGGRLLIARLVDHLSWH